MASSPSPGGRWHEAPFRPRVCVMQTGVPAGTGSPHANRGREHEGRKHSGHSFAARRLSRLWREDSGQ